MFLFSYSLLVFVLGACIGSFLNVVILRTHAGKSLGGRSECPHCKHELATFDLIPILSYLLLLSGKCRYCGHKLSPQYPLVEFLTAAAFVIVFLSQYPNYLIGFNLLGLLFSFFVSSVLIVITVTDIRWGIIPDKIILPASLVALFYQVLIFLINTRYEILNTAMRDFGLTILTTALLGGFFLALILITKGKGMGGGDLKLAIFIGLALGFPSAVIGILLGFLTGAIGSVMLLLLGKKGLKSSIAFGPFLALGAYFALVFGPSLWTAYLRSLGF